MADVVEKRRPHPALVALAVIGALTLVTVFSILVLGGLALKNFSNFNAGGGARGGYLAGFSGGDAVAGVRLDMEVTSELADEVIEKLRLAEEAESVKGILLEVNSPGGSVVASQEIYDAVNEVKATKPVVVYVREMAASGAYYASAPATRIVANRGSLVGSIGVIFNTMELTKLVEWAKLIPVTIKTGKLKDAGSPLRPFNEEDKQYLQNLINRTHDLFVTDVKIARNLPDASLARMADGRVVLGTEAADLKLVDKLGNKETALNEFVGLLNLKEAPELIYMENPKSFNEVVEELMRGGGEAMGQSLGRAFEGELTRPKIERR